MLSSVQGLLDAKCLNTYAGADAVWLCIEAHDPPSLVWQMEQLVAALSVPDHKYERIYLGFHASLNLHAVCMHFSLQNGAILCECLQNCMIFERT